MSIPGVCRGAIPSPNIWNHPAAYEVQNLATDPDGVIASTIDSIRPYADSVVLDIGCGTGFHLPRFAETASRVIGVEPHPALMDGAVRRTKQLTNVEVLHATAQSLPLPGASVDVVHARWAYFFGPGCEPGLAEIDRVLRRGGAAFLIDNDARTSTFGRWFGWDHPTYDTDAVDRFFGQRGWTTQRRTMRWAFASRAAFEQVVRIEFSPTGRRPGDRRARGHRRRLRHRHPPPGDPLNPAVPLSQPDEVDRSRSVARRSGNRSTVRGGSSAALSVGAPSVLVMAKTPAKKPTATYRCGECGWTSMKWVGRCGECQAWGTVEELGAPQITRVSAGPVTAPALPISQVKAEAAAARPSGVGELDRVLGGGIVPGAVLLLAGEPGVGKSTLLLEVTAQAARRGQRTLYVSGEESASQVRLRAERTGALEDSPLPRRGGRSVRGSRAHRSGAARPAGDRLDPDHRQR